MAEKIRRTLSSLEGEINREVERHSETTQALREARHKLILWLEELKVIYPDSFKKDDESFPLIDDVLKVGSGEKKDASLEGYHFRLVASHHPSLSVDIRLRLLEEAVHRDDLEAHYKLAEGHWGGSENPGKKIKLLKKLIAKEQVKAMVNLGKFWDSQVYKLI